MSHSFQPIKDNNNFNNNINNSSTMPSVEIITPSDPEERGAQLSLVFSVPLNPLQEELQKRGVVVSEALHSLI